MKLGWKMLAVAGVASEAGLPTAQPDAPFGGLTIPVVGPNP